MGFLLPGGNQYGIGPFMKFSMTVRKSGGTDISMIHGRRIFPGERLRGSLLSMSAPMYHCYKVWSLNRNLQLE